MTAVEKTLRNHYKIEQVRAIYLALTWRQAKGSRLNSLEHAFWSASEAILENTPASECITKVVLR